ncbi:hypothetical protein N7540_009432 [Penicillium herquei]|nr:hypothetical protein N7540_009432 [Penicillium herquei]
MRKEMAPPWWCTQRLSASMLLRRYRVSIEGGCRGTGLSATSSRALLLLIAVSQELQSLLLVGTTGLAGPELLLRT